MVSNGTFYGIVVTFVALLLVSSTFAVVYYNNYQQSVSQNNTYAGELGSALASYNRLSGSFNSSLEDYNTTLSLLATAVANLNTSTPAYRNASAALVGLWGRYEQLAGVGGRKALVYTAHLLVDFGNGTRKWYNGTTVQPGWDGYVASLVLLNGNIQAAWYPQYGEHFVTGVDGVSQTGSTSWFVWEFSGGTWNAASTGADQIRINNGTTIAWTLCGYDTNFNPTCAP
jgi:hypothetical protein